MARFADAARRFALLLLLASTVTIVLSLVFGVVAGASVSRAVSVGFYIAGCFLLVVGFFAGNRGPARLKSEEEAGMFGLGTRRRLRWATADEREESINASAVYVAIGAVLIVFGVLVDTRYELV